MPFDAIATTLDTLGRLLLCLYAFYAATRAWWVMSIQAAEMDDEGTD